MGVVLRMEFGIKGWFHRNAVVTQPSQVHSQAHCLAASQVHSQAHCLAAPQVHSHQ